MSRNIETKAPINNMKICFDIAQSLSSSAPELIEQEDYFFNCENGRLKLRIFSADKGELIFYNRENCSAPKTSEYFTSVTNEPSKLLQVLKNSYGIRGIVKKTRTLFLIGRSRVHIDQVESLGNFLEFEVILSGVEDTNDGKREAYRLMNLFGIEKDSLIDCAYIDLIKKYNL
jgi:adenylate cyclase